MKISYSVISLILLLSMPMISSCRAEGKGGDKSDWSNVADVANVDAHAAAPAKVSLYEAKEAGKHPALTGNQQSNSAASSADAANKAYSASSIELKDEHWKALQKRLKADNMAGAEYDGIFARFSPYDNKAMATKVKELYRIKFVRPVKTAAPEDKEKVKRPAVRIYPGIVTPDNMLKAKVYLEKNAPFFDNAHKTWGVPPEIAVGLLLLETKLGTYLGNEKALWSLACMAASESLDDVEDTLKELGVKEDQKPWLEAKVKEKSSWAYNEFKALLVYSIENNIDGNEIPGSVYGAIGYCQFMPSNIKKFGVDATGKGKIDLFTEADAIASLSNFLHAHGWRKELGREARHKVLMCYNRSTVYANTILAVADHLNPPPPSSESPAKAIKGKAKVSPGKKATVSAAPAAAKPKAAKARSSAKVAGKKS